MKIIYQRWFVEYKFPGNTEIIHTKFPRDWNLESIGKLFESQSGYAFSSKDWRKYGIPVLTIKCINEDGSINYKEASFIQKNEEKLNKYTAKNGNIIFAMSGNTIGKTGIVASNYKDLLINQRILIIKSNSSNLGFIYFTLKNPKIQNIIFKLGANSAQPNISEEQLKAIKVVIPNQKILKEYNGACKKYFDIIIENRIENQYLAELKEYLLPLLINGQINVDDIEI